MRACRTEAVISRDGTVSVKDLPFQAGERVEVIVLEALPRNGEQRWQGLKGSVLKYDRPTDPVGVEDWEALR